MKLPSPEEEVFWKPLQERGIQLFIKRDDLIHDVVSGNKWRKLRLNLEEAVARNAPAILTFGGAFSNHIVATAAACNKAGIRSYGIIRGDELSKTSNDTLRAADAYGMELVFVDRDTYGWRHERSYHQELWEKYGSFHIVPEGGANYQGILGCADIVSELRTEYDHLYCASGTGTTCAGIMLALGKGRVHAINVVKGVGEIDIRQKLLLATMDESLVEELLLTHTVSDEYHFGGYAKGDEVLYNVMRSFYEDTGIKTDPVYTGKVLAAILYDSEKQRLKPGECVLMIHTGGLQGIAGYELRNKLSIY